MPTIRFLSLVIDQLGLQPLEHTIPLLHLVMHATRREVLDIMSLSTMLVTTFIDTASTLSISSKIVTRWHIIIDVDATDKNAFSLSSSRHPASGRFQTSLMLSHKTKL